MSLLHALRKYHPAVILEGDFILIKFQLQNNKYLSLELAKNAVIDNKTATRTRLYQPFKVIDVILLSRNVVRSCVVGL
jgi:hypothetical protein